MKKIIILTLLFWIIATASASVLNYGTITWESNDNKIIVSWPTEKWEKDLKSWNTSYNWPTINWNIQKNGFSVYETPTMKLEKKWDYIKYTASTIMYEKKWWDIIYTTPTTKLTISKNKIKYETPTINKEIDWSDWKFTTPTSEYSN